MRPPKQLYGAFWKNLSDVPTQWDPTWMWSKKIYKHDHAEIIKYTDCYRLDLKPDGTYTLTKVRW